MKPKANLFMLPLLSLQLLTAFIFTRGIDRLFRFSVNAEVVEVAIAEAFSRAWITFAVTGTIALTSGELAIDKNLSLVGPGAANLVIDANRLSRVFSITNASVRATISGLTVRGGQTPGAISPVIEKSVRPALLAPDVRRMGWPNRDVLPLG